MSSFALLLMRALLFKSDTSNVCLATGTVSGNCCLLVPAALLEVLLAAKLKLLCLLLAGAVRGSGVALLAAGCKGCNGGFERGGRGALPPRGASCRGGRACIWQRYQ